MNGKPMRDSNTAVCMAAPTMLFFTCQYLKRSAKLLDLESNSTLLVCHESHLFKAGRIFGFLSALKKQERNGSLPMDETAKTHGIAECYHTMDLCTMTRSQLDDHGR
jgi:hypothetical protein